jgi:DNA (cytosine-5)-methyltransferase 1
VSPGELIIDSFAGGGGASLGIEMALGRSPDVAINHDAEAIALHAANHPAARHYREDVWKVDPREATGGRPVGLMWLSPDCKHFSKAKGGKPVSKRVRGLAWVAVRWASAVRPRVIVLENVEEFTTWGPVLADTQRPCPDRKGTHFRAFKRKLERLGYVVDHRMLRACDFGAPTIRRRLFLVARCDGQPIVWPQPTHAKDGRGGLQPWRTAAECIDWSISCPSIFERRRPLAAATLRRIAAGIRRFVIDTPRPYIVQVQNASSGDTPISLDADETFEFAAFLAKHQSERHPGEVPGLSLFDPAPTVKTRDSSALVTVRIAKLRGANVGHGATEPMHTISAGGTHFAEVRAFLCVYYGNERDGGSLFDPMRTVTSKERFGLVTVEGQDYAIADIGMRMLAPRELYRAQGFPDSYRIDVVHEGRPLSKTAQVRMVGNSVCPPIAAAIVRANLGVPTAYREVA